MAKNILEDPFARRWFVNTAKHVEKKTKKEELTTRKTGNLGAEVELQVRKKKGIKVFWFSFSANKFKYEQWARQNKFLMEGILSFRIGPIIWSHPGRSQRRITRAGIERPVPINIWDMTHSFLNKNGCTFFNLFRETIWVDTYRLKEEDDTSWVVERTR